MKAMHVRSPSGTSAWSTGAMDFAAGVLSPVSADSSISSAAALISLPSAGTTSPASTATMSPGTSSATSTSLRAPARRTFVLRMSIFCRAATLASALPSWLRPRAALKRVSASRRMPAANCPGRKRQIPPATRRTICIGSRYWRRKARHFGSALAAESSLRPCSSLRAATSSTVRPI